MADTILRCKIDGFRAFDRIDFSRHMESHWEHVLVEITELVEKPPHLQPSETVASGMVGLFGDEE